MCRLLLLLVGGLAVPARAEEIAVEFRVSVPADTKSDAQVYLAGNLAPLGGWKADGLALRRGEDGRYRAKVALPRGAELQYKVTLGSWRAVEKDRQGRDIPNRKLIPEREATVDVEVASWSSGEPRRATRTGELRTHADFHSRHLDNERTLIVWLPPGYAEEVDRRYPVFYLQDGQNLFDAATAFGGVEWQADETADKLIRANRLRPVILVGIYNNADRVSEYTPWRDGRRRAGGRGKVYARFVAEEVKPFIDAQYRTLPDRDNTAIGGSSLGGLIALYIASAYSDRFGMCAAVSPSVWWGRERLLREIGKEPEWLKQVRFWLDMGTSEGGTPDELVGSTRRLVEQFDGAGLVPGRDYYYWEVFGGVHNEAAWAARFDKILLYFFAK